MNQNRLQRRRRRRRKLTASANSGMGSGNLYSAALQIRFCLHRLGETQEEIHLYDEEDETQLTEFEIGR